MNNVRWPSTPDAEVGGGLRVAILDVWTGARERLRTVVMTTLVAALGFVPMAIARPPGPRISGRSRRW